MTRKPRRVGALCLASVLLVGAGAGVGLALDGARANASVLDHDAIHGEAEALTIQYLEIVTPEIDKTCAVLASAHGISFGDPIAEFGSARTAELSGGGRIGVRAPMRATEDPVVRPYVLVDDIQAAVKIAEEARATIAMHPTPIPGQGMFAIYILGGIEHGVWEL